ncbi:MAG TPA: AtpZ/AtpI family protein [Acidobacteriaceae bacterium]
MTRLTGDFLTVALRLSTPLLRESMYNREGMAFNAPPPGEQRPRGAGATRSLAQAERLLQIAFVLPCAMLLCWGAGWWLDQHFHTKWMTPTGIVFGIIAGMVSAIRLALQIGDTGKGKK